jgi:predicted metal-dependent phosphoesterase TrpH
VAGLKLKLDLHIHSIYSSDSINTIDSIIEGIKLKGLHGYALADHDTIEGHNEAYEKKGDIVFIPAQEISAKNCHVLAYDPNEPIARGLTLGETVDRIHEQGATAVLAHPFGIPRNWISVREVKQTRLDAIEVANAAQFPYNYILKLNRSLAKDMALPETGGSDSHIPSTLCRAYTIVDTPSEEVEDVLKSIRMGRTEVFGSGTGLFSRIKKLWKTSSLYSLPSIM